VVIIILRHRSRGRSNKHVLLAISNVCVQLHRLIFEGFNENDDDDNIAIILLLIAQLLL